MGRGYPRCGAVQSVVQVLDVQVDLETGLVVASIIMGALAFMTVEPARPPRMASNTSWGSTPAILARVRASDRAWMLQAR